MLKLKNMRLQNTLPVMNIMNEYDSISRVELARKLNCNGTTVTRITKDLISKGILKTAGLSNFTGGRPREKIELNADWKNAIGIALDPDYITGVIVNIKGKIIVREQVFFRGIKTGKEFLDTLTLITDRLLNSCEREKLLGIGIATFGTFSGKEKILENVAQFPSLEKFDIKSFFQKKYSIIPEVANTTIAKTFNEIWFNKNGSKGNFILFNIGSGIGCAIAIDGKIVFNRDSYGGELGHTTYQVDGAECECGKRGCLETLCSINAIKKNIDKKTGTALSVSDIINSYIAGNPIITDVVNDAAKWIGIAVANQINLLAPDEIVLSGEVMKFGDDFYNAIHQTIEKYAFHVFLKKLKIIKSGVQEETTAIGAASFVICNIFENFEYIDGRNNVI